MGIANTSSATLIAHKLTGAGLDRAGAPDSTTLGMLARKRSILARAAMRTAERLDARGALREYGGFRG